MFVDLIAIFLALVAVATGLLAVGQHKTWDFCWREVIFGRADAVIYSWVTLSTIFSLWHLGMLTQYHIRAGYEEVGAVRNILWMMMHSSMSILFSLAHMFIKMTDKIIDMSAMKKISLWEIPPSIKKRIIRVLDILHFNRAA